MAVQGKIERRYAPAKRMNPARSIAAGIEELLQPIRDLFALLAEADTPEGFEEADFLVKTASTRWAATLVDNEQTGEPVDDTADTVAQSLAKLVMVSQSLGALLSGTSLTDPDRAVLWRSDVGQLIFKNNGFPRRAANLQEAAAVLGLTRQAVSYLLRTPGTSRLETVPDSKTLVTRVSLYREWQRRDAIEKANNLPTEGDRYR
jgi:hypothetical protein